MVQTCTDRDGQAINFSYLCIYVYIYTYIYIYRISWLASSLSTTFKVRIIFWGVKSKRCKLVISLSNLRAMKSCVTYVVTSKMLHLTLNPSKKTLCCLETVLPILSPTHSFLSSQVFVKMGVRQFIQITTPLSDPGHKSERGPKSPGACFDRRLGTNMSKRTNPMIQKWQIFPGYTRIYQVYQAEKPRWYTG